MAEAEKPFQRNKILSLILGPGNQAEEKTSSEFQPTIYAQSSINLSDTAQFIYPHIDELDQILKRFKERNSNSSADNF